MDQKIILTGFGPFGDVSENPSAAIARGLNGEVIGGHAIIAEVLPVEFETASKRLRDLLRQHEPALAVCLGVAASRRVLSLERVAINLMDARIPDNAGTQPLDQPVVAGGPSAYFTSLPIKAMKEAMTKSGATVEVSNSAGTYVCNCLFYALMHALRDQPDRRGGFIHVPPATPEQDVFSMVNAVRASLETAISTNRDLNITAGAED